MVWLSYASPPQAHVFKDLAQLMEDVGPLGGEAFVEGVGGGGMSQE